MRIILAKVAKPESVAAPAIAAPAVAPVAAAAPDTGAAITAADINPAAGTFTTVSEGDLAIQGLCEKAVENAYGTTGVWASANAHWNGASPKHTSGRPPKGAFVYWNISQWATWASPAVLVSGDSGSGGPRFVYPSARAWLSRQGSGREPGDVHRGELSD